MQMPRNGVKYLRLPRTRSLYIIPRNILWKSVTSFLVLWASAVLPNKDRANITITQRQAVKRSFLSLTRSRTSIWTTMSFEVGLLVCCWFKLVSAFINIWKGYYYIWHVRPTVKYIVLYNIIIRPTIIYYYIIIMQYKRTLVCLSRTYTHSL